MDATSNKENAAAPVPEGFLEMLKSLSPEQLAGLGLVQEGGTAAAGSASGSPSGEQPPKRSKSDAVPVAASPPPHGPAPSAVVAPSPAACEPSTEATEGVMVAYQAPPPSSSALALTGGGTLAVVPPPPRGDAHAHEPSSAGAGAAADAAASIGAGAAGTADLTAAGLEQHLSALPDDRARIAHLRTLDLDTMEGSSKATKALRKAYLFNLLSLMAKVRRPVSVASGSSGPAPLLPACTAPTPTRRASHLHHRCSTPTPGRLERQ